MGLSQTKFKSRLELFYEKIGLYAQDKAMDEAMFHGLAQEDYIAWIWEHHDGGTNSLGIPNYVEQIGKDRKSVV